MTISSPVSDIRSFAPNINETGKDDSSYPPFPFLLFLL
jgi:hypothetical protein